MGSLSEAAIPIGSIILVTGVSGFLGSNIADQFLAYGYRVRGTTRNAIKAAWLSDLFEKKYGSGKFSLVTVSDMVEDDAYICAVKGVVAVVHSSSVTTLSADPNHVIPGAIAGAINAIKAAYSELGVKRFVLTSSSAAAIVSRPGIPGKIVTTNTWNEQSVQEAWAPPPYKPIRQGWNYAASKTLSEQAVWKYHNLNRLRRPDLVVNTILPNVCFGKTLDLQNQAYPSSNAGLIALWKGEMHILHKLISPQFCIDVSDVGRLHVAAAILAEVQEDRIFGIASPFSWDAMLEAMRKLDPHKDFMENFHGGKCLDIIKPAQAAEGILKRLGRPGWISFEEMIERSVEDYRSSTAK